jgi:hypothetical protein
MHVATFMTIPAPGRLVTAADRPDSGHRDLPTATGHRDQAPEPARNQARNQARIKRFRLTLVPPRLNGRRSKAVR